MTGDGKGTAGKRIIRYEGPAPKASALVQLLEEQGIRVHWEPPIEERGGIVEHVLIPLLVTGAYDARRAGVRIFIARFPGTTVDVGDEHEEPHEDEP